ncbi:ribose-phosphate diphosphokinase [Halomonas kalidii]|uniref:ribose-phosphate diphosphokinase n=1 Tax=Halomonas kalidii TaxID=3043293 RepID=A0ABT6VMM7_9GAMM|nr:ribose-phosphate pyrophosphokinase [Halomonas kalidii]MDI5935227.1 ribose-phosphate pyrophosphokinase [Halomonas kalidii]
MKLFALNTSRPFGEQVAKALGISLAEHEERDFEDGEHKARPLVSVRGQDVYVLQSLHGEPGHSVNDKLCRLLFFLGAMREASAQRVTAVIPYLAYARKDRQTKPRDPVTTRYMAMLLEAMGIDAVMTLDVHNLVAFQNAFRCRSHALDTRLLFGTHMLARCDGPVVVASPDPGGVKRAQGFQETFQTLLGRHVGSAFMEKRRSEGVVSGTALVGDVAGATVLVVDDLISTGGTLLRAAEACLEQGAQKVYGLAAHGLFVGDAGRAISDSRLTKVIVTDTIPPHRLDPTVVSEHLEIVSAAPLFAEAIRRIHEGGSLTELLEAPG